MSAADRMRSRLVTRIEQDIAQAQGAGDRHRHNLLRAQRAGHLIRHGALDAARAELTPLHQAAFGGASTELTAWLQLAEGLMALHTDYGGAAQDHIEHATTLAEAGPHRAALVLALSLRAQLAYMGNEIGLLVDCARRALELAQAEDGVWLCRTLLVVAATYHYIGDLATAQRWYDAVRRAATRSGDDAMLAAMLFNTAELRMLQVRQAELRGDVAHLPAQLAGIAAVQNFDTAIGTKGLQELNGLLEAKALVTEGAFERAIAAFEAHLPQAASREGMATLAAALLADLAWCRAALGQRDAALALADQAQAALSPNVDLADVATTHARLCQSYTALGDTSAAAHHSEQAKAAWAALDALRLDWLTRLNASGMQPPT